MDIDTSSTTASAIYSGAPAGIDAIGFSVPRAYVELADLAQARGVPPAKYTSGLGTHRMAVADSDEDTVTLAADAARRVLAGAGRDAAEIGLCIVGTETAVDHSKPVAAYLHSLLGLPQACRVYEAKHACFGGTAGLLTALDWIAAGSARGRSALVVCTDIARYPLRSAGEPTQGAGAVALLIRAEPRLLELEVGRTGSYARDVHDFYRPLFSKDAITDGHFSVQCYLDALTGAYGGWQQVAPGEELCRSVYHVPYGKMAVKAHRHRRVLDGLDEADADATFAAEVGSSLLLPAQVGNIYTGSLYLALASLLLHEAGAIAGRRIGLFSYGSGCSAEFFAGRVCPGAPQMVQRLALDEPLQDRRRLTIPEYEALRQGDAAVDSRPAPEGAQPLWGVPGSSAGAGVQGAGAALPGGRVVYLGIDKCARRVYSPA